VATTDRADPSRLKSISILFEDDFVLVVSKPAGMAVHAGAGEGRTVIELLGQAYAEERKLYLVHRLDRGTSGVLLVAKSSDVARKTSAVWDRFEKTYLAVALGRVREQTIDRPIPDDDGKPQRARTAIHPRANLQAIDPETTLLDATIETGRTHQIRRHLQLVGHPILMDDKHGDFAANKRWSRAVRDAGGPRPKHSMLHAHILKGPHPLTREPMAIRAETPPFWREILSVSGARVDALADLS
jgi:23S rRNA pseudouridine955/2504/2580 synthase